ncbi:MAG: hypothetical protein OXI16_08675 [Chloroflexota bacterium]|nr:hypothetical protein [Chloroflexota bacterium]
MSTYDTAELGLSDRVVGAQAAVLAKAKEEERRRIEASLAQLGVQLDKEIVDEVFCDCRHS